MEKIGNNDRCPCGSGKKYKKCCRDKKPRQHTVMVGSPVPLKGFHYNRATMTLEGIAHDGQLVKPDVTFSQICYIGESGKEKVLTRTHDKVIPNEADLMIHLSSFDMIIAVDTNTKEIGADKLSVSGIVQCQVRSEAETNMYAVELLSQGAYLFRNCPQELSPEKFGWLSIITELNRDPRYSMKKYCLVSDHDLDNHNQYNCRKLPILGDIYLPPNVALMYGRGDGSKESILNNLVMRCDKEASRVIKEMEETGFFKCQDKNISISQIPIPTV
jgi:hypothetical protein